MKTITLTSLADNVQAHILQDILKEQGIESMLQGELTHQVMSPLANLGIQILIFENDLERAKAIVKESFPNAPLSDYEY